MNIEQAENLKNIFLSKAPKEHYYFFSLSENHQAIHLFDGVDGDANKLACIVFINNGEEIFVELFTDSTYSTLDYDEVILLMVNNIPSFIKELTP